MTDSAQSSTVARINDREMRDRWLMAMAEAGYPKTIGQANPLSDFATFHPPATTLKEIKVHLKAYRLVGVEISDRDFMAWVVDHMDRFPGLYEDEYRADARAYLARLDQLKPQDHSE